MTQQFIGQIQPFAFTFAPKGWAFCNGQLLPIQQNQALFSLIGTYYGGNGTTNFALPDLRGRVPLSYGTYNQETVVIGEMAGSEKVTLSQNEIPQHNHLFQGSSAAGNSLPVAGAILATSAVATGTPAWVYGDATALQPLNAGSLVAQGQNLQHENMQPYLVINWCIALVGIFPSRS